MGIEILCSVQVDTCLTFPHLPFSKTSFETGRANIVLRRLQADMESEASPLSLNSKAERRKMRLLVQFPDQHSVPA
ncbi:hypothetical protein Tco_0998070 [Tanacetum coccineum]